MDLTMVAGASAMALLAAVAVQGTLQALCLLAAVVVCLQAVQVVLQWQHHQQALVESQLHVRASAELAGQLQEAIGIVGQTVGGLQTSVQDTMQAVFHKVQWVADSVDGILTKVVCSRLGRGW